MKDITPTQYAKLRGITLQAVTEMIRKKNELPGVKKIIKMGRFYVLKIKDEKTITALDNDLKENYGKMEK